MKYLDTGSRNPDQALAQWLAVFKPDEVDELRIQSGFFSIGGIGLLLPILSRHAQEDKTTRILIGSNDGSTLRADVLSLAGYMGTPREHATLGVVSFDNAYFHPKTYHVRRTDGSQCAYVGSSNLSAAGLALHIEAGISLDTREGDDKKYLIEVASAIDAWIDERRDGLHVIDDIASIEDLVQKRVLTSAVKRQPRPQAGTKDQADRVKTYLKPVVSLPPVKTDQSLPADEPTVETATDSFEIEPTATDVGPISEPIAPMGSVPVLANKAVPRDGFPQYLLFDPAASGPTRGVQGLTGTTLPSAAAGLVVQLNLDSARHFMGGKGTANISIPIASVGTIRFGVFGVHSRPRAEFALRFRYLSNAAVIDGGTAATSIQGYGFTATESGHADIRMLVPADIRAFGEIVKKAGHKMPTNGDFALLEWPTAGGPEFRLTFVESGSQLGKVASTTFAAAVKTGQVVGQGACWLEKDVSPAW
jgi:hypothetical protein